MSLHIRLIELSMKVRSSYWFLPTLLASAGLVLGLLLVLIDAQLGENWLGRYEWFYGSRPEGARAMLSTIAGSTITVAGVVFSITLAAVTYASGQFGPRLLGNFMQDRGNQATLGVFIGTYLYCLVVLRTIRSAEETGPDTGRDAFVPHLAMFGGLALAIASTAVLIYFVHHVTSGIHINNVIAKVGYDLIAKIRCRADEADPGPGFADSPSLSNKVEGIVATKTGYIEAIDFEALLKIASRNDIVVRPVRRAGDFVAEGWTWLEAHSFAPIGDRTKGECTTVVSVGRQRTAQQDLRFGIDELVEIAARALSPGVNDPFTAIACIDWLGAALGELDARRAPPTRMIDEDGSVRILLCPLVFEDYLGAAFGQLRSYVAADPNARTHALDTLKNLALNANQPEHRALIEAELARLGSIGPNQDV